MGIQSIQAVWFDSDNHFAAGICSTDIRLPLRLVKKSVNYWVQNYPTSILQMKFNYRNPHICKQAEYLQAGLKALYQQIFSFTILLINF